MLAQDNRDRSADGTLPKPAQSPIIERIPLEHLFGFAKTTLDLIADYFIMRSWYGRGRSLQVAVTACCLAAFILYVFSQSAITRVEYLADLLPLTIPRSILAR